MKKIVLGLTLSALIALTNCDVVDALVVDVTGNVSENGDPVQGVLVILLNGTSLEDGVSLTSLGISNSDGDFTIFDPDKGDYYVAAIDDVNDNLKYDEGVDRFGFHGMNPEELDFTPAEITVDKKDVENIDIVYLTSL